MHHCPLPFLAPNIPGSLRDSVPHHQNKIACGPQRGPRLCLSVPETHR
ncbi:hypothetical protein Z950_3471 [Sulfitobacter mediterraneus KCTC 32188]|nr:hypothetical protein Z950_3471 [Sulfitobacter mediterraneus KCTC 32188]